MTRLERNVILRSNATKNPFPGYTRGTDPSASPQDDIFRQSKLRQVVCIRL